MRWQRLFPQAGNGRSSVPPPGTSPAALLSTGLNLHRFCRGQERTGAARAETGPWSPALGTSTREPRRESRVHASRWAGAVPLRVLKAIIKQVPKTDFLTFLTKEGKFPECLHKHTGKNRLTGPCCATSLPRGGRPSVRGSPTSPFFPASPSPRSRCLQHPKAGLPCTIMGAPGTTSRHTVSRVPRAEAWPAGLSLPEPPGQVNPAQPGVKPQTRARSWAWRRHTGTDPASGR